MNVISLLFHSLLALLKTSLNFEKNLKVNKQNGRRIFESLLAGAVLLWGSSALADTAECDVVVVGGGSAGTVAAIQSGRLGAKTILLEAASILGGNTTVGGVNSPESFFKWKPGQTFKNGKQVIAGIGWEWCSKTAELDNRQLPDSKQHYRINPAVLAAVGEELCLNAGVKIRYFESPVSVERISGSQKNFHWKMTTCALGEMRTVFCKELIDCTGNGSLCALAGAKRMREKEIMAGSFNFIIKHKVDLSKLPKGEYERLYKKAIDEGRLKHGDARHGSFGLLGYQAGNYVYDADNSTAELRTETNIRGRQLALRVLRFIRTLPGGEDAVITTMFPEVGVRETWRIQGEHVMKVEDYLSGKTWEDSICFACYQVDLHKPEWKDFVRKGLAPDIVPTIPLRALIPAGFDHLMAAGRCISADRETISAVRIQSACMATGQAAGAAAALSARNNVTPKDLEIKDLKKILRENGAIVP